MSLDESMQTFGARIEASLDRWLPPAAEAPEKLHEAMRYSVLGGGKRVRPLLVYLTGTALGVPPDQLDGPAVSVELIHAYSLIHDDLPAMDNDDLRRGRPTCHKVYGDAMAILAGDALQALAFHVLAEDPAIRVDANQRLAMLNAVAIASGSRGMAGGQGLDLQAVGHTLSLEALENMHLHKTGALIRASVRLGALSHPGVDAAMLASLDDYARCIGLAFQVQDDILDVEGETATIGKPQGSDLARNKPTYPNLLGLDGAKAVATRLYEQAVAALAILGQAATPLRELADYIVRRNK
jgi:farnesyl diphosphate synthase